MEIAKIILAAINFREGTLLKTSDSYQNIKVLGNLYMEIFAFVFYLNFQVKERKK